MWVRFSGFLARTFSLTSSKDLGGQPVTASSLTPAASAGTQKRMAKFAGMCQHAALMVAVVAACLVGASTAVAQAPPDPATLVPTFVDPTAVLTVVQTKLTALFLPFIMFSIGVMLLILIWRTGKRYAGGHS